MYQIVTVPDGAAQQTEPLGTKYKFWYRDANASLSLFKEGRPNTGENWAEKIACELAAEIHMPHAFYELAVYENKKGVITRSLVENNARVIHGNELLPAYNSVYEVDGNKKYRNPQHTLRRVIAYLKGGQDTLGAPYGWKQTAKVRNALDFFVGYLLFDVWIANQDRHDENWGVLRMNDGNVFLSPSYDHGSSLGRNELDSVRKIRMTTKDMPRHITAYAENARSGFFPHVVQEKPTPLYTLDAFAQIAQHSKDAGKEWQDRLAAIDGNKVNTIISNVPTDVMTDIAKEFTEKLLEINRARILKVSI